MIIMYFFELIPLGVHWPSWMCGFMSFTKLGKLSAIISSNIIFASLCRLSFSDSHYVYLGTFDGIPQSVRFYSFSSFSPDWIISIDLCSGLLMLPSICSNLLLKPFSELFILVIILFNSRISILLIYFFHLWTGHTFLFLDMPHIFFSWKVDTWIL